MSIERSAGAVVFREEDGKRLFLLLSYPSSGHRANKDYWDLPKGHIEKGESENDAAKREVKEETGLESIVIIPGFKETIKYFFRWEDKDILKFVTFYLAKTQTKEVNISDEHNGFDWLPHQEALKRLSFKNAKEIIKKADRFLFRKGL
jgi:bis(5'-nucleosidyl)-tetraphosphatase